MRGIRIALISILAGIIIGLVAIMILVINGRLNWFNANTEYGSGWALFGGDYNSTLQNTTSINVSDMEKLNIDYTKSPFDVIFLPADGSEMIVEEYFSRETPRDKMAKINQSGDTVTIKQQYFTGINVSFSNNIGGYIKVYLPADAYTALKELSVKCTSGDISLPVWEGIGTGEYKLEWAELETVSGDMSIGYLEAKKIKLTSTSGDIISGKLIGDVTTETVSGEQKAEEIRGNLSTASTSGDIRITSVIGDSKMRSISGGIRISSVTGDLNMGSTSGDLQADALSGKGEFSTSSGEITVALEKWQGDIYAESVSGDVRIILPGEDSFHFEAESVSGSIDTPYDSQLNFNKRGTTADGTIGNNAVYRIKISTTSGDISLRSN